MQFCVESCKVVTGCEMLKDKKEKKREINERRDGGWSVYGVLFEIISCNQQSWSLYWGLEKIEQILERRCSVSGAIAS